MVEIKHKELSFNNGLEDVRRRENRDFSEFNRNGRSFGTGSSINRVYTDITVSNNTKVNHTMVFFTDHYNAIYIGRRPS